MQKYILLLATITIFNSSIAQDTSHSAVFERIMKGATSYKLNTSTPPNDKVTKKIVELRGLRGGFNINEAIAFKIEEDRRKKEMPEAELKKLSDFFTTGQGKTSLDNAVTWIYRDNFTYKELKQLVKFYKTSAGRKMADNFPVIMLQSLAAAEQIKEQFMKHKF
jgi:uncharacterized protein